MASLFVFRPLPRGENLRSAEKKADVLSVNSASRAKPRWQGRLGVEKNSRTYPHSPAPAALGPSRLAGRFRGLINLSRSIGILADYNGRYVKTQAPAILIYPKLFWDKGSRNYPHISDNTYIPVNSEDIREPPFRIELLR